MLDIRHRAVLGSVCPSHPFLHSLLLPHPDLQQPCKYNVLGRNDPLLPARLFVAPPLLPGTQNLPLHLQK
jgi:hypothetical protein